MTAVDLPLLLDCMKEIEEKLSCTTEPSEEDKANMPKETKLLMGTDPSVAKEVLRQACQKSMWFQCIHLVSVRISE